jgi:glycosyltransferase involved in cell wall biosynthesis
VDVRRSGGTTDERPKRVLMVTKGLGRGGAERLLVGTARLLDRSRFTVEVVYLLPHKDAFVGELEGLGVPVHLLAAPRPWSLGWLPQLRRLVRERRIDLVHTHMPLTAAGARLALPSRSRGGPAVVHTEHNLWDRYRRPTRLANALTWRRNAAVVAVSQGVADSIRRDDVAVHVVPHGTDLETFARAAPDRPLSQRARVGSPTVGSVGNFTAKKDHATLLAAFAKVRAAIPDARLVLVGIGPLEDALRRQAHDLDLAGAVEFTGRRDDVEHVLPGFDVFALSSRYEGLPIALLEAMAAGVAPVVTAVGGIPEVLSDGHDGLLVPPGDPDALAQALIRVLGDDGERARLADAARARAQDFDLATAVPRLEALYQSVLGTGSPSTGGDPVPRTHGEGGDAGGGDP